MDLHPDEAVLSGAEDEDRERSDQDLQIRRTVTQVRNGLPPPTEPTPRPDCNAVPLFQVVHSESQENGQKEAKRCKFKEEEEEDEAQTSEDRTSTNEEKVDASPPAAMDDQPAPNTSHDMETSTGNKSLPVR